MLVNNKKDLTKEDNQHIIVIYQQGGDIMDFQKVQTIEKTISMLMRLDEKALILIENSAETLKKYKDLKDREEEGRVRQGRNEKSRRVD